MEIFTEKEAESYIRRELEKAGRIDDLIRVLFTTENWGHTMLTGIEFWFPGDPRKLRRMGYRGERTKEGMDELIGCVVNCSL